MVQFYCMKPIIELEYKDFFDTGMDSPLRRVSTPVNDFGDGLHRDVALLKQSFRSMNISVGLAAPQIDINKRICIMNLNKEEDEDTVLINPVIVSNTGKMKSVNESCLSLPRYRGPVKRKEELTVRYQDTNGKSRSLEAIGFLARVILHEIDHLDGILFVDRMENRDDLEQVDFKWE